MKSGKIVSIIQIGILWCISSGLREEVLSSASPSAVETEDAAASPSKNFIV